MSEDSGPDEEIHIASEDAPVLTAYEPDFQRIFARGTLLRSGDSDDDIVQMAFWSSKDTDIEVEEEEVEEDITNAVGYRLESEVMMHWNGILRLRNLLDNYIDDHAPERYLDEQE